MRRMAREQSNREDLLAEATALVERVEIRADGFKPIVMGFRRDGSWSVFFGASPVYQFNSRGELRRAYADDLLYKAEEGRLVSLRRERRDDKVLLLRHELTREETAEFLARASRDLNKLRVALSEESYEETGRVPQDSDVVDGCKEYLAELGSVVKIAHSARAG